MVLESGSEALGYKRLRAWQKAHELAARAFDVAAGLPSAHRWLRRLFPFPPISRRDIRVAR